ncbi:hypothetical protein FOZ61_002113, partial [Perkinsus olseni]
SNVNRTMAFHNKVSLPSPEAALAIARLYCSTLSTKDIKWWKSDHAAAYRQVPCSVDSRKYTVILLKDPDTGSVFGFYHLAQPFGASSSVINYCRVSQALAHIGRVVLAIPVINYLDDYFGVERSDTADSANRAWIWLHKVLGWRLNDGKGLAPTRKIPVLGLDIAVIGDYLELSVPKDKSERIISSIEEVLDKDSLPTSQAHKLIGKLTFASGALDSTASRPFLRALHNFDFHKPVYFSSTVNEEQIQGVLGGRDDINVLEMYAVLVGLETFGHYIRGRWLTVFVDNTAVEFALVGGAGRLRRVLDQDSWSA